MFNFKTRKQLKEEMESLEKQLEYAEEIARDYWRNELNKQWVGRQKTAINLNIARRQLKREQELRGIDQGRATQEKIELKLDLKKTKEEIEELKEDDSEWIRIDYRRRVELRECRERIERLEEENKKWGKWELNIIKNAVEEATEAQKLEFERLDKSTTGMIDQLRNEKKTLKEEKDRKIKALEREKDELKKRLENILTNKDNKVIKSYAVIPKQNNEVVGIVRK